MFGVLVQTLFYVTIFALFFLSTKICYTHDYDYEYMFVNITGRERASERMEGESKTKIVEART